ncbi:MAG: WYL domain-containing protein [Desulfosporosinus sp.]
MNLHLRMETILTMVEANPGITGQRIVDACAVPWSIIKKDLETMLLSTENHIPLYTDQDEDGMTDDDIVIEFTPETKWFLDTYNSKLSPLHLTVGEAFQILSSVYIDEKHPKLLSLRQKILNSLDLDNQGTFRYIKGSMTPVIDVDEEVLLLIEQAISRRRQIGFAYNLLTITAIPLGLVYYSRLRQWYLAAINDSIIKTFNISKIQDIKEIPKTFVYPSDFSLKDWLAPRWGMEFGDPLNVKVRFINRAQTIAKVRKDVAHRQCKLTEENGGESLLYEDTIIGRNEFLAWILGFGSAATVLEQVDLRDEIIVRVKATLGNYK